MKQGGTTTNKALEISSLTAEMHKAEVADSDVPLAGLYYEDEVDAKELVVDDVDRTETAKS